MSKLPDGGIDDLLEPPPFSARNMFRIIGPGANFWASIYVTLTVAQLGVPALAKGAAKWVERVNEPLTECELAAVRLSAQRGRPLGDEGWVESTARRLNVESTIRPRGRQRVRQQEQEAVTDA